jgi:hypothetical protein
MLPLHIEGAISCVFLLRRREMSNKKTVCIGISFLVPSSFDEVVLAKFVSNFIEDGQSELVYSDDPTESEKIVQIAVLEEVFVLPSKPIGI